MEDGGEDGLADKPKSDLREHPLDLTGKRSSGTNEVLLGYSYLVEFSGGLIELGGFGGLGF